MFNVVHISVRCQLFQVKTEAENSVSAFKVKKKSTNTVPVQIGTNHKGAGSLANIIPDWPKLKSFDRTKEKKKVSFWQTSLNCCNKLCA